MKALLLLAYGHSLDDVVMMSSDELTRHLADKRGQVPLFRSSNLVQYLQSRTEGQLTTVAATKAVEVHMGLQAASSLDSMWDKYTGVVLHYAEELAQKVHASQQKKLNGFDAQAENRIQYLPCTVISHSQTKEDKKRGKEARRRWSADLDLRSINLLQAIEQHKGWADGSPVVLPIQNNLQDDIIHEDEYSFLHSEGYTVAKDKHAYRTDSKAIAMVQNALPKAIDFCSYISRFTSPLLPGGYLADVPVRVGIVRTHDGADQKTDGSGLYDPNHPTMQPLVRRFGKKIFQFTFVNEEGVLCKGIVVPREKAYWGPEPILLDWIQVKGDKKSLAKKLRKTSIEAVRQGHLGVMKTWSKPCTISMCFEGLECLGITRKDGETSNSRADQAQKVVDNAKSLTQDAMRSLLEGTGRVKGKDRLLAAVARDNPNIDLIVQFGLSCRKHGFDFNPMAIPMVYDAVEEKLQRKLWKIAQGAGIVGKQLVVVMDDSVPEGCVVADGFVAGQEIALWRFPMVLPQGWVNAKVIKPSPHHMVDGRIIANAVFMNPKDIVNKMQGDDDGDIVGASADSRVVQMSKCKLDDRIYLIEPEGTKFDHLTLSDEGRAYMMRDPRGPVGICTVWRSSLLSAGDRAGALAMSVLIQECIDSAKNHVRWTDPARALDINNWHRVGEKTYAVHVHGQTNNWLSEDMYEDHKGMPEGFPMKYLQKWYFNRLKIHGVKYIKKQKTMQNTIGWKKGVRPIKGINGETIMVDAGKRIILQTWKYARERQLGCDKGNLVHTVHDHALDCWVEHADSFGWKKKEDEEQVNLTNVLNKLLRARNQAQHQGQLISWEKYLTLREKSGLKSFGKEYGALLRTNPDPEAKALGVDRLFSNLRVKLEALSTKELATIWMMETTTHYKWNEGNETCYGTSEPSGVRSSTVNNVNNAFRAVCWSDSPIMELLGMQAKQECSFMGRTQAQTKAGIPSRAQVLVWRTLSKPDPVEFLRDLLQDESEATWKGGSHSQVCKDSNGHPVRLLDCPDCMRTIQDTYVRTMRKNKTAKEKKFISGFISRINHQYERTYPIDTVNKGTDEDWDTGTISWGTAADPRTNEDMQQQDNDGAVEGDVSW